MLICFTHTLHFLDWALVRLHFTLGSSSHLQYNCKIFMIIIIIKYNHGYSTRMTINVLVLDNCCRNVTTQK